MIIRLHDLAPDGEPVPYSGEYCAGPSAIAIVERLTLTPFTSQLTPMDYMRRVLERIGQAEYKLPDEPADAAARFLMRLTSLGYASFEAKAEDFIPDGKTERCMPEEDAKKV